MHLDIQLAISGLGAAGAIALLALGLVVIFKGSGVLNFAHGAIATAAVYTYDWLYDSGWPVAPAVAGGLVLAIAIGAVVEAGIMRRLGGAPLLAKLVATLGVMLTIQATVSALSGDATPRPPSMFTASNVEFSLGSQTYVIGNDRLAILAVAVLATVVLAMMFKRTRFGVITRALADSEQAVLLTGTSVHRIALANWCFGALLAGLAGILLAGIAPTSPTFFTTMLVAAIAAALVGGLRSFSATFLAALLIGVAQPVIVRHSSGWEEFVALVGWAEALPVLVIIGVVLFRGSAIPMRDTVAHLALPRVPRVHRPAAYLVAIAVAGALWYGVLPERWADPLTMSLIGALVCLSLVLLVGFTGQISLGQMAFAGFAALVTVQVANGLGLGFPWAGLIGAVAAVPVGLVFGLPALRVRGIQLAVVTLGAGLVLQAMVFSSPELSGSRDNLRVGAPSLGSLDLNSVTNPQAFGAMTLVTMLVAIAGVLLLRRAVAGQRMLAVRENERGAAAAGISVTQTKLLAFVFSSLLAGTAGALLAYRSGQMTYESFDILMSVYFIAIAYLGGIGSVGGALIAGIMLAPSGIGAYVGNQIWHDEWMQVLAGLVLLQVVVAHPNGLTGLPDQIREARAKRSVRRHRGGIHADTSGPSSIRTEPAPASHDAQIPSAHTLRPSTRAQSPTT